MIGLLANCCCESGCKVWRVVAVKGYFGFPSIPLRARTNGHWETGDDISVFEQWKLDVDFNSWSTIFGMTTGGLQFPFAEPCAYWQSDLVKGMTLRSTTAIYRYQGWYVHDLGGEEEELREVWHQIEFQLDDDDGFISSIIYSNSCGGSFDWSINTTDGSETTGGTLTAEAALGNLLASCGEVYNYPTVGSTVIDWHAEYANARVDWSENLSTSSGTVNKPFSWEYRWVSGEGDVDTGLGLTPDDAKAAALAYLDYVNLPALTSSIPIVNNNTVNTGSRSTLTFNCFYYVMSSTGFFNNSSGLGIFESPWPRRMMVYEIPIEERTAASGENPNFITYGIYFEFSFWYAEKGRFEVIGDHQQHEYSQTGFVNSTETDPGACPELSLPTKSYCADNPYSGGTKFLGPSDLHSATGYGVLYRKQYLQIPVPRSESIPGQSDVCSDFSDVTMDPCE